MIWAPTNIINYDQGCRLAIYNPIFHIRMGKLGKSGDSHPLVFRLPSPPCNRDLQMILLRNLV